MLKNFIGTKVLRAVGEKTDNYKTTAGAVLYVASQLVALLVGVAQIMWPDLGVQITQPAENISGILEQGAQVLIATGLGHKVVKERSLVVTRRNFDSFIIAYNPYSSTFSIYINFELYKVIPPGFGKNPGGLEGGNGFLKYNLGLEDKDFSERRMRRPPRAWIR